MNSQTYRVPTHYRINLYEWLTFREGGSESPCRWFYVTGIYTVVHKILLTILFWHKIYVKYEFDFLYCLFYNIFYQLIKTYLIEGGKTNEKLAGKTVSVVRISYGC